MVMMITIVMIMKNNENYGGVRDHPRQVEEERLHNCTHLDDNNGDDDERIIQEPYFFEADDTEYDVESRSPSI